MALHVHRSNRLEALAAALDAVTRAPLRSVLTPEVVVVQSLGMRRWLSLELAQRHGVAMNVQFPFPAKFAQDVFRAAFPGSEPEAGFQRELLPWRVLALLPRFVEAEDAEALRSYLAGENGALKAYQLALRIAALFDRYLAYRPELLLEWQAARGAKDWQAVLWRELAKGRRAAHPPALLKRLQDAPVTPLPGLPERVSVFGISSLPPLYLHLIETVAQRLDVHLFLLEPTDQYWADTRSPREQDRILRGRTESAEDLHLDTGNALLSSFGKMGREFARLVADLEPLSSPEFYSGKPTSKSGALLDRVQADIFALRNPAEDPLESNDQPAPVSAEDASIRIHRCHGPMREVEILHDQLLDLFQKNPALTPRDILVAMPDVESYAPFVEAIFGAPEQERLAIPYSIADRSARTENSVADAFLRLLDLHGSRFTAPAVLALLDCPAVRRRFGLTESDLEVIRAWVAQTGIRWGIDEAHRESFGLPRFRENTWRAGLERLLLGYALPGDGRTLFEGLLPEREVEGALALTLGAFVEFAEALFMAVPALSVPRPLPQWESACRELLRTFFDEGDESADEVRRLRDSFGALSAIAQEAEFGEAVTFEVLRAHLAGVFGDTDSGLGFLAGCVTFCALKPMRAIPFKVICLLGMNDTAFPRRDPELAFDRMVKEPRRGDRSQRDDDRALFLEAILSAREVLCLSYSGLSPRDNSESPPSVVVSEFLDYLEANYACESGKLREALVTEHRLQPFSPAYFSGDPRLFSYSAENARTSERGRAVREAAGRFAATPLGEPDPEWRAVEITQLADFFAHPAKFFAQKRLRLALPEDFAPLEETEPLALAGLARYGLSEELTQLALQGVSLTAHRPVVRAGGLLPFGYAGDSDFGALNRAASGVVTRIRQHVTGAPLPPRTIDATLGEWRLTGTLHDLYPAAQLRHRAAAVKGKDLLRAWIHHLALQLGEGEPRETLLFGKDVTWRFAAVENAPDILADLLALYGEGLRAPLPLFPETSHEFARRVINGEGRAADPVKSAAVIWRGGDYGRGESEDAWFRLCFPPAVEALDARWQEIAQRVFAPLFAARQEVES